jgi:hypothetical protein
MPKKRASATDDDDDDDDDDGAFVSFSCTTNPAAT